MTLHPATPEELAAALRAAHESGGRVERADLSRLARVLEHTPEDMTVTVEAGCTLAALQRTLKPGGQWLPIDPPNPEGLTLAELLDRNVSGPRRGGCGTIRDYVIGLRVALADGRLIRNGGKVVKNVAGYDLIKMFIGARGTLGVIVEVAFKLLPLPAAEAFVQAGCESLDSAEALIARVLDSELTPVVFDAHNHSPANDAISSSAPPARGRDEAAPAVAPLHLVLGFAGSRAAVDWQLALAGRLGFTGAATLDYEAAFHAPGQTAPHCVSVLPSRLVETLRAIGPAPFVARAANGILHHRGVPNPAPTDLPRQLNSRVKQAFDPNRVLPEPTL